MLPRFGLALLGWLVGTTFAWAQFDQIVVPNANANVPGGSENSFPFNITPFSLTQMRYQQVYASSQFVPLNGGTFITRIAFRPSTFTASPFSSVLPSVDIYLSTAPTGIGPGSLSPTFDNNSGVDETLVYSGALPLSSANTGSPARDFDIIIDLQTPFFYNPALGHLLLEVVNFQGGTTTPFDAITTAGTLLSRVYAPSAGATTGSVDSSGLITQFTYAAIPEPTSLALLGTGLAGGLDVLRRRFVRRRRAPRMQAGPVASAPAPTRASNRASHPRPRRGQLRIYRRQRLA